MSEPGSYRRDGPWTMKAGAEAIAPEVGTLRARVFRLFDTLGAMTDKKMVIAYRHAHGGGEYRSLITRRRELVDKGFIQDTGKTALNLQSNVPNIIWAVVPEELRESYQRERQLNKYLGLAQRCRRHKDYWNLLPEERAIIRKALRLDAQLRQIYIKLKGL